MRTWVIVDGERKMVDAVDRGELLLYSRQEWFDRYYRVMRGRYLGDVLMFFLLMIINILTCLVLGSEFLASMNLVILMAAIVIRRHQFRMGVKRTSAHVNILPGLHRNGLQFPTIVGSVGFFFPYIEMREVRTAPKRPSVAISFEHLGRTKRVYIDRVFLGEDGLALLQSLAGHAPSPSPASPPRLVVYPSSDR